MSARFVAFAALVAALVGLAAQGSGQAQDTPAPKVKRTLCIVRHADSAELAATLAKHFKGDADIQAVPASNALLVRATADITDEVVKLVGELDRRPRTIAVELYLIEASAKADDNALDEKQFSGAHKAVLEKIEALKKKGAVTEVKRFQITAVEGSAATVITSESKPFTTGVTAGFRAGGKGGAGAGAPMPVARNVTFRDLGTQAKVTARTEGEKSVVIDLDLSDSRMHTPKDAIVIGQDENGAPVHSPEFVRASLKSKLTLPAGQMVAAKDVQTSSKSGQARTLVLATARVVEP